MKQEHLRNQLKASSYKEYKLHKTILILVNHIDSISSVKEWTQKAKVSQSWLTQATKEMYRLSPKEIMREVRYEKIVELMQNDIEATSYSIAKDAGLKSGAALRMFLKRQKHTNFKKFREKVVRDELRIKCKWLNRA